MASEGQLSYEERVKLVTKKIEQLKEAESKKAESSTESTVVALQPNQNIEVNTIQQSIVTGFIGFILGTILTVFAFSIKIKRLKQECKIQVDEARAALDRMLTIASNK